MYVKNSYNITMRIRTIMVILVMAGIPLVAIPFAGVASANPIPIERIYEGRAGGSPLPQELNEHVYFAEERVIADIGKTTARVDARYTFRNTLDENVTVKITLPFPNEPWDIMLKLFGRQIGWSWGYFEYRYMEERFDGEPMAESMPCINFEITIAMNGSATVDLEYSSKVSVYDFEINWEVYRWFSYLVGSAESWNRSIDHAYFEFRMPKGLYDSDEGSNSKWDISERKGEYVFMQEYRNWTPEEDFIELSWETDRPVYEILMMQPCFLPALGISLAILIIAILIITLLWKRARKRK